LRAPEAPQRELEDLIDRFYKYKAPPSGNRPVGVQEIETILCKHQSHSNGRYWVGKDIHEMRLGLKGCARTAEKLLAASPKEVEESGFLL
jgi:hypothetical protein